MPLTEEEMKYSAQAWEYVENGYYRRLLGRVPGIERCRKVLDVGAGPGGWLLAIVEMLGSGVEISAADISDDWLLLAGEKLKSLGVEKAGLSRMDAQSLAFEDNSFDLAISSLVLPYVPDEPKAVREMIRVLVKGGKGLLLFHEPYFYLRRLFKKGLKIRLSAAASMVSSVVYIFTGRKIYRRTFQSRQLIERLLKANGCRIVYSDRSKAGIGVLCFSKDSLLAAGAGHRAS